MGGKRITTIPICYRLFLLMFLIVNVQVCKMDLKCAFGINLGISGELKMRECVLPSGSGCVGTCAAQGVAQYLTGCTHRGTGLLVMDWSHWCEVSNSCVVGSLPGCQQTFLMKQRKTAPAYSFPRAQVPVYCQGITMTTMMKRRNKNSQANLLCIKLKFHLQLKK